MTLEMFALGFVLPRVTLTISTISALFLLVIALNLKHLNV